MFDSQEKEKDYSQCKQQLLRKPLWKPGSQEG